MKNSFLVLKFKDKPMEYSFGSKVSFVEDKKLCENLSKINIKNRDSELIIHSLNDVQISDVIQIKVNMAETGTFLINFEKGSLGQEKRNELLKEIGALKNEETPTQEGQLKKTKKLVKILEKYEPIYVSFSNTGEIKLDLSLISEKPSFPLLVLTKTKKKIVINFKKKDKKKEIDKPNKDKKKVEKNYAPLSLFETDYIFILLFALLGSIAITATIFEIMSKQMIAIFLGIISLAFVVVEAIAMQSSTYKKNKLINPYIRYYLSIFIVVGITIGIVAGYFISKGLLKTEIENFDYKKMLLISIAVSVPALISSVFSSIFVNFLIKKFKKNKTK